MRIVAAIARTSAMGGAPALDLPLGGLAVLNPSLGHALDPPGPLIHCQGRTP